MTQLKSIAERKAEQALRERGYTIEAKAVVNDTLNTIYNCSNSISSDINFFLKYEKKPFGTTDGEFPKGVSAITINRGAADRHIADRRMDILYYEGEADRLSHTSYVNFRNNRHPHTQNVNGEPVYMLRYDLLDEWV